MRWFAPAVESAIDLVRVVDIMRKKPGASSP